LTTFTLTAVFVALVVSSLLPFAVKPWLRKLQVVDIPNARSSHAGVVLRGGGIAPLLGIFFGASIVIVESEFTSHQADGFRHITVLGVVVGVGVLGLLEDLHGVRVMSRALVQLLVGIAGSAVLVATAGVPVWWIPVAALFFVAYTNAANFMDGIDTLSALHGLTVGGAFAIVGVYSQLPWLVAIGLIVSASFAAFLFWNLGPNRMFLGDVGSYTLGGGLAIVGVAAAVDGVPLVTLVGPLAIYLADTGTTLLLRLRRGEPWKEAHRSHVYQRLVVGGLSHVKVSALVTASTLLSSMFGIFALRGSATGSIVAVSGIVLTSLAYLMLPRLFGRFPRRVVIAREGRSE
jgi:UDP-N-acetylmuramyl pentapeptide phosphotransferase/UDP-N-acetylglucosamine-1-phosphate transferase